MRQPSDSTRHLRLRLLWLALTLLALLALALAWSWSPLRAWLDIDVMVATLQRVGQALGPLAAVGGFALAVSLAVPLTFVTLVALAALGPWAGLACAMAGALLGVCISYGLGFLLGREVLERLAGERLNALSRRLSKRGVLAIVAVRMMPIAPFAIVNMITGASHISLRDVLLGTAIGMTPSTLVMMVFMNQLLETLRQPGSQSFLLLMIPFFLILVGLWCARHWLRQPRVSTDD
jgi:uncharacterized membrane protein YdjX (TVP38/TMEM64 family)